MVDNDESLVSAVADLLLEFDNLSALFVSESSFTGSQLFSLFGGGEEETRVDFGLFVFEGDVQSEDVAVFQGLGHIGMSGTVIQNQTSDETTVSG